MRASGTQNLSEGSDVKKKKSSGSIVGLLALTMLLISAVTGPQVLTESVKPTPSLPSVRDPYPSFGSEVVHGHNRKIVNPFPVSIIILFLALR